MSETVREKWRSHVGVEVLKKEDA